MTRIIKAPTGSQLTCKNWQIEAAYRMIQNNLDPQNAEKPDELIVYGGLGKAARNWEAFDAILASLQDMDTDETLLVQSGKPVGVVKTHDLAPRVIIANSNLVPKWATWDEFRRLDAMGLMMYGQMTAGSWIYIGTQGIVQGTLVAHLTDASCLPPVSAEWVVLSPLPQLLQAQQHCALRSTKNASTSAFVMATAIAR